MNRRSTGLAKVVRAWLNGYRLGYWPQEKGRLRSEAYRNPDGFIEVTPENEDTRVSEHFRLRDFLTKDQPNVWPKYLLLNPKLLDKLELVIQEIARWHGDKAIADIEIDGEGADLAALFEAERPDLTDQDVSVVAGHPDIADEHIRPPASQHVECFVVRQREAPDDATTNACRCRNRRRGRSRR